MGCTPLVVSTPNNPFSGSLPSDFNLIENTNPTLALEYKKLPEFQDGLSGNEEAALTKIIAASINSPSSPHQREIITG